MVNAHLFVFGGLPGTALARRLAAKLRAVYLRIDSIEQAMRKDRSDGLRDVADAGYRIAYAVARDNLDAGVPVVADCVNPLRITRDAWRTVGSDCGVGITETEVMCSNAFEHRRRVDGRNLNRKGAAPVSWADVVARTYETWDREPLLIDTADQTEEQSFASLLDRLGLSGSAASAASRPWNGEVR